MVGFSLPEIASALPNGRITAGGVSFTPPGHSNRDRSGRVLLHPSRPFGIWVQSLAHDDELDLRDYVLDRLGVRPDDWREAGKPDPETVRRREEAQARFQRDSAAKDQWRRTRACEIWDGSLTALGSTVHAYMRSRAIDPDEYEGGAVVRFHPLCPWEDGTVPAMVCAMRDINPHEEGGGRYTCDPRGSRLGP